MSNSDVWELKRQKKIQDFISVNGEQFLADFPVTTIDDMLTKYKISYPFYKQIEKFLSLSRNDDFLAKQKSDRYISSMKSGGLDKVKSTMIERYGVSSSLQLPKTREATKKAVATPEVQEKIKTTLQTRYGVSSMLKVDEIHSKGVVAAHTEEALSKSKQTRLNKFGVSYCLPAVEASHTVEAQQKRERTRMVKYGTLNAWNHEKIQQTLLERYGVNCSYFVGSQNRNRISKLNTQFAEDLAKFGVNVEFEKFVAGHSYDLAIGKYLIELNPTISHSFAASFSQLTGLGSTAPIPQNYHYKFWQQARAQGYEQLSLFDWTDRDAFIQFILSKLGVGQVRLYARNLFVQQVTKTQANKFFAENHLLGARIRNNINLALVDSAGTIFEIMSFEKKNFSNSAADFELLRLATLKGYSVVGGASKLFKHFTRDNPNSSILTYSDNNFGNGSVYPTLGFVEASQTGPQIRWCDLHSTFNVKHLSLSQQGADRLLSSWVGDSYFPVGLDRDNFLARGGKQEYAAEFELHKDEPDWWPGNADVAKHYGLLPVADCGSTKWLYIPKN